MKEITLPFEHIEYIHHIADIHIRNLKRHKEYKKVFRELYKKLRKQKKNSIIYLGGDIVHSKTELSPEVVEMTWSFLEHMADIMPTFVITGNHDINLSNKRRLDALSPIINNMAHPNLFYLKDTGLYKVGDVIFSVMSVLDSNKDYIKASDIDSKLTKIALFHGPVNDSITDTGFIMTNRRIRIDVFNGYDLALLGDIHKQQFLNESKTISYPGSLIQQNHGEDRDKGYLLWNVPKRKSEFVPVKNEYGYYTLEIEDGTVPQIDDMPKRARLRLKIKNTDRNELKRIMTEIRKLYPKIEEIRINRFDPFSKENRNRENKIDIGDISDPKYQNDLIVDYLRRHLYVDDEVLTKIQEINHNLNSELPDSDVIRNITWKPSSYEFSNMFSYGENNKIDFSKMKGIIGIFAPNTSGKSSFLDSLSFCLFDKTPRVFKAGVIMNNKKNKFNCKLKFNIDDKDYFIERIAKKTKSRTKVDVNFYFIDESGEKQSLNADQRYSTNARIREYIGSYEDFILTSMASQREDKVLKSSFVDMRQSDRKELLAQFLDLKIFDQLYDLASEKIKDTMSTLKELQSRDFDKELANTQIELDNNRKDYKEKIKKKNELEESKEHLSSEILRLSKSLIKIDDSIKDIDSLDDEKGNITKKIESKNIELSDIDKRLSEYADDIKNLEEHLTHLSGIEGKYQTYIDIVNQRKDTKQEIEKLKIEVSNKLDKLKKLDGLEYDPNCKYCMNNIFVKDAINTRKEIEKDKVTAKKYVNNLDELDKKIGELGYIEEQYQDFQRKTKKLQTLNIEHERISNKINQIKYQIDKLNDNLFRVEDKIKRYYKNEEDIKSNEKIESQIDNLKQELNTLNSQIRSYEKNIRLLHGKLELGKEKEKQIQESMEKAEKLEEEYIAYEYYIEAVKRDGIPYELITKTLPTVESEINNILSQMVDFGIMLEVDGKNINAFIVYDEENIWPVELVSGMERFVSSIAIRVALLNVSSLPRPNFLAIDEGFSNLDSENINSVYLLFDYLKNQFDFVLVISHIDAMRDLVDSHIEIKKSKGFSKINYIYI